MRRELRDPLERCEHAAPLGAFEWYGFWHCRHNDCPGGKLVVMESEWRCEQGDAYFGPCSEADRTSMPHRHWTCGVVWVEVTP